MTWRRFGAAVAAAGTLGTGTTVAVDSQINPYEVSAEKYELASVSTIEAAGENKVEAHRDRPAVTLSKWNGEAAMTVAYGDINAEGSRQFLTDRVEWKGDSEELHAYPLPAGDGMEDGGFEIEIILDEIPATNVFEFTIEGAEDLDFFYQPALTDEESAEGAVRPENVIGSYAVYHKTKANHRVGDTNYATGKAYHIYRPKAFAADGAEVWAELSYSDGVLAVTVPQEWLEKAAYPVVVDPTIGSTTIGGTTSATNSLRGVVAVAPENGSVTTIDMYFSSGWTAGEAYKATLYEGPSLANTQLSETTARTSGGSGWQTFTYSSAQTITSGNTYGVVGFRGAAVTLVFDVGAANSGINNNPGTYPTWPATVSYTSTSIISV